MKCISAALWAFLLTLTFSSCQKERIPTTGTEEPVPVGVATAVGTPDGTPVVKKTIGAEGGTLTSGDGRLSLIIPAGALTAAQEVSIQAISNHNPMALKQAYRLQPHQVTFSKPVTIRFAYDETDIQNTITEALGIAYQDDKGIWQAQGGTVLDKTAKTVSVNTQHFSDWSLFESIHLIASGTMVPVKGTISLEVFSPEDLFIPLEAGKQVPIGAKVSATAKYIKEWKLAGAGSLQPAGSKATYTAPAVVPTAPNPVAVSVSIDLKKRGTALLLQHIEIVNDDGEIELSVAGNGWVKKTLSPAVKLGEGYYGFGDSDGDTQGSYVFITWKGGVGTHAYKAPDQPTGTHFHYHVTGIVNYSCSYMNSADELVASGGGITITSMGEEDGFIKGTFTVTPARYGDFLRNTINIEGKFRVRKGW